MDDVRIDDHSDEYKDDFDSALEQALESIGIHIEGEAKEELENSPRRVDTGLLRNSITYAIDGEPANIQSYSSDKPSKYGKKETTSGSYSGNAPKESNGRSVIVGSNVAYAPYVHEGTTRMPANRFLKNALERNKDQVERLLKEALG